MTIIRRVARPLLAAPLIQSGLDVARHPAPHLENAKPVLDAVSGPLKLPDDRTLVVRAAGGVTAGAGVLLALGRFPRLAGLAIVATAPIAQATAPFWTEKDPELKRTKRNDLLKTLGLVGGALLAAVDTEGDPGLAWRSRRAAKDTRRAAKAARVAAAATAVHAVEGTGSTIEKAALKAEVRGRRAVRTAEVRGRAARKQAKKSAKQARRSVGV